MQAMQTSMGFPLGMSGALPGALSGAYPGPPVIPTTRTPTRPPTQMASTTVSSSPDVISLLQRTLAQKESEISKLKAEGEANVRRYEQQLQEVKAALSTKTAYVARLEEEAKRATQRASGIPVVSAREQKETAYTFAPRQVTTDSHLKSQMYAGPLQPYHAVAPNDPIDVQLEATYNQSSCTIPFKRINKGWYLAGRVQVEMDIVNHKLMVRCEEWNRGKFGPIERFLMQYMMGGSSLDDVARRRSSGRH